MAQGSRTLNEQSGVLGLNTWDLIAGALVQVGVHEILFGTGWDILSFPAAILFLLVLIPIRRRYRRKMVRDFLGWLVGPKCIYDPKRSAGRR